MKKMNIFDLNMNQMFLINADQFFVKNVSFTLFSAIDGSKYLIVSCWWMNRLSAKCMQSIAGVSLPSFPPSPAPFFICSFYPGAFICLLCLLGKSRLLSRLTILDKTVEKGWVNICPSEQH